MQKVIIGICIICFTTFCGYALTKKYRQRKSFFWQLKELNERYLHEIAYYKRPLKEFLRAYPYVGEFALCLEDFWETLENGARERGEEREEIELDFLTADEKTFLRDYFSMLGRGDSLSQKNFFSAMQVTVANYKNKSEEEEKRYGDLYIKLGFLFGLAVLVLII